MMYRKASRVRKGWRVAAPALLASLLVGCLRPLPAPDAPPSAAPETSSEVRGGSLYEIDPESSEVHIHVYRGGALARLGHNHVVTSRSVSGRAWLHERPERSGFELSFPAAELIVDDPEVRSAAGPEFATSLSEDDRQGTRANMLREEVLDAQHNPTIRLRSVRVEGALPELQLTTRITVRNVSRDVVIPAQISADEQRLTARGEFDLLQTDFEIRPFTVALGALAVQDRLHVRFTLAAQRTASPAKRGRAGEGATAATPTHPPMRAPRTPRAAPSE